MMECTTMKALAWPITITRCLSWLLMLGPCNLLPSTLLPFPSSKHLYPFLQFKCFGFFFFFLLRFSQYISENISIVVYR
ncbi:hypothetical protein NC652_019269 [Populus alba x Populus x berolinensis]|nr:hypothetical protein NC652_019269 [Populus alba x Populus x berolinensis]